MYNGLTSWEGVGGSSIAFQYLGVTMERMPGEPDGVNTVGFSAEAFFGRGSKNIPYESYGELRLPESDE
tara:strand:+ start:277 stop:483 length:207 start_codon:yes stop_codon:yes gene_type:complete